MPEQNSKAGDRIRQMTQHTHTPSLPTLVTVTPVIRRRLIRPYIEALSDLHLSISARETFSPEALCFYWTWDNTPPRPLTVNNPHAFLNFPHPAINSMCGCTHSVTIEQKGTSKPFPPNKGNSLTLEFTRRNKYLSGSSEYIPHTHTVMKTQSWGEEQTVKAINKM